MKKSLLLLVFGWFFTVNIPWAPDPTGKASLVQVVGPFTTKAECEANFEDVKDMFTKTKIATRFRKCFEQRDV